MDDEEDVLTYLETALEDQGYETRGFSSASGVLDAARESRPDLLCLDIMMPSRSGLSLFREIRSTPSLEGVPIVIVSGYSREEDFRGWEFAKYLASTGLREPEAFVEKPVDLDRFLAVVGDLARRGG